jgi:hypothetical protein
VFDPFDLTRNEVRLAGAPMGLAIPHHIGRHTHPKAKPETPSAPTQPSGIDYARLIEITHQAELAHGVNHAALTGLATKSPDSSTCSPARRWHPNDGQADLLLRLVSDAVRPRPGPVHAAPPQRAQRSSHPYRLVSPTAASE